MAFAQDIRTIEAGLAQRIATAFKTVAARYAQYRLETKTYKALSALSDRELEDLGLNRSGLRSIAHEAATHN